MYVMTNKELEQALLILPSKVLEGKARIIEDYTKETGVEPTQTQIDYIGGWFTVSYVNLAFTFYKQLKIDRVEGREYNQEEIRGFHEAIITGSVYSATLLILNGSKTLKEALEPYKDKPYEELKALKCVEAILIFRGVFEGGILPANTVEMLNILNAQAREYREKGLLLPDTVIEAKAEDKSLSLASGNLPELMVKQLAQTTRGNKEVSFNNKNFSYGEEELLTEGGELVPYISIEKDIKGKVYSKLTVKKALAPTHERAITVLLYVLQKIEEAIYIKGEKAGGKVELNIKDLVGEGKPFSRLQYATEPFEQVTHYLQDLKFKAHYSVGSTDYRKLSMSVLGRVDTSKGNAIEELTIFTGFTAYQDGTCYFYINDKIKNLSPVFHKVASFPVYGKYTDKENALFFLFMHKYRGGKRKNSLCKIKNEDILDYLGFGDISKERNKQRFLKEALRILEGVKEKDNKECFEAFEINYNKGENTAYKMLKSLTVSIRIRPEKITHLKGEDYAQIV